MNYMKKLASLVGVAVFGLTIACCSCAMDSATSSSIVNESALNSSDKAALHELMPAWKDFYSTNNWQELIRTIQPLESGCGTIYQLPKESPIFLTRSNETGCIADMTHVASTTHPHFHRKTVEVYFILQGSGIVVVGGKVYAVRAGDVVFIPLNTGHFTAPDKDLVLAVVNIPFFSADDDNALPASDEAVNKAVCYDHEQYMKFACGNKK